MTHEGVIFKHNEGVYPVRVEAHLGDRELKLTQVDVIELQKLFAYYRIGKDTRK